MDTMCIEPDMRCAMLDLARGINFPAYYECERDFEIIGTKCGKLVWACRIHRNADIVWNVDAVETACFAVKEDDGSDKLDLFPYHQRPIQAANLLALASSYVEFYIVLPFVEGAPHPSDIRLLYVLINNDDRMSVSFKSKTWRIAYDAYDVDDIMLRIEICYKFETREHMLQKNLSMLT